MGKQMEYYNPSSDEQMPPEHILIEKNKELLLDCYRKYIDPKAEKFVPANVTPYFLTRVYLEIRLNNLKLALSEGTSAKDNNEWKKSRIGMRDWDFDSYLMTKITQTVSETFIGDYSAVDEKNDTESTRKSRQMLESGIFHMTYDASKLARNCYYANVSEHNMEPLYERIRLINRFNERKGLSAGRETDEQVFAALLLEDLPRRFGFPENARTDVSNRYSTFLQSLGKPIPTAEQINTITALYEDKFNRQKDRSQKSSEIERKYEVAEWQDFHNAETDVVRLRGERWKRDEYVAAVKVLAKKQSADADRMKSFLGQIRSKSTFRMSDPYSPAYHQYGLLMHAIKTNVVKLEGTGVIANDDNLQDYIEKVLNVKGTGAASSCRFLEKKEAEVEKSTVNLSERFRSRFKDKDIVSLFNDNSALGRPWFRRMFAWNSSEFSDLEKAVKAYFMPERNIYNAKDLQFRKMLQCAKDYLEHKQPEINEMLLNCESAEEREQLLRDCPVELRRYQFCVDLVNTLTDSAKEVGLSTIEDHEFDLTYTQRDRLRALELGIPSDPPSPKQQDYLTALRIIEQTLPPDNSDLSANPHLKDKAVAAIMSTLVVPSASDRSNDLKTVDTPENSLMGLENTGSIKENAGLYDFKTGQFDEEQIERTIEYYRDLLGLEAFSASDVLSITVQFKKSVTTEAERREEKARAKLEAAAKKEDPVKGKTKELQQKIDRENLDFQKQVNNEVNLNSPVIPKKPAKMFENVQPNREKDAVKIPVPPKQDVEVKPKNQPVQHDGNKNPEKESGPEQDPVHKAEDVVFEPLFPDGFEDEMSRIVPQNQQPQNQPQPKKEVVANQSKDEIEDLSR